MDSFNKLIEIFRSFPGIGPRQAKRFVYFLLTRNETYLNDFINQIKELKKDIKICSDCFRYFTKDSHSSALCNICRNPNRTNKSLMIVSRDVDFENIEKSHSFEGKYFILGGSVPILDKEPEKNIRLKELLNLIEKNKPEEIILGLNANIDGEHTGQYICKILEPLTGKNKIKISHLGRGLSTGTELEYSDSDTIKSALENRK